MRPLTVAPVANDPSKRAPNHWPNSFALVIACQTRARGARNVMCFSIRSVLAVVMCNLVVAYYSEPP
jgi:hypothetical protein